VPKLPSVICSISGLFNGLLLVLNELILFIRSGQGLFRNPFIWIATFIVILLQLLAAYFSPLAKLLGTIKPFAVDWAVISACTLLSVGIVEITKLTVRRRQSELKGSWRIK